MMLLSILICSLDERKEFLNALLDELLPQCGAMSFQVESGYNGAQISEYRFKNIQIITACDDRKMTTGAKRNLLLSLASGKYVVFIDDDDIVSEDYVSEILKAIETNPDVVGFAGYMTTNGSERANFKINKDLPYISIKTDQGELEYLRFNNHLSPVKREIALQIKYPDMSYGEDYDYARRLKESGLIKTEVYINKQLYHYKYIAK